MRDRSKQLLEADYPWARFSMGQAGSTLCCCAWCEQAALQREGMLLLGGLGQNFWHIAPGQELTKPPDEWYRSLANHRRSALHTVAIKLLKERRIEGPASPEPRPDDTQKVRPVFAEFAGTSSA